MDGNVIAYLFPYDGANPSGRAARTIALSQNDALRIPPALADDGDSDALSRFMTHNGENGIKIPMTHFHSEGLQLRFDHPRKHRAGFLIGRGPECDIVLPRSSTVATVGRHQCLITFDRRGRLILRELRRPGRKKDGTTVQFNYQGGQKRRNFTWILSDDTLSASDTAIVITFHDNLRFELVVAAHNHQSPSYQESVQRFHSLFDSDAPDFSLGVFPPGNATTPAAATTAAATDHNPGLDAIQPCVSAAATTATAEKDQSPDLGVVPPCVPAAAVRTGQSHPGLGTDVIVVPRQELGRGAQAAVSRVRNVSTGDEYAAKDPLDRRYWDRLKQEAKILKDIHHEHIVGFVHLMKDTKPRLLLEYVPCGNLYGQARETPITAKESIELLQQGLAALRFLHNRPEPIAHRDIKPENVLVQSRVPFHIKLADFGLAKESADVLRRDCGLRCYAAPEIYADDAASDESADIWSLGVLVFGFAHCLPVPERHFDGMTWARDIVQALRHNPAAGECLLLALLSKTMLIIEPGDRFLASDCCDEASRLSVSVCCGPPPILARSWEGDPMSLDGDDELPSARARQIAEDGVHFTRDSENYATSGAPAHQSLLSEFARISTVDFPDDGSWEECGVDQRNSHSAIPWMGWT